MVHSDRTSADILQLAYFVTQSFPAQPQDTRPSLWWVCLPCGAASPHCCSRAALQEIFIRYGNAPEAAPSESNTLYAALTPEVQALVRPYFDSRFSLLSAPVPPGPIFGTNRGSTFQRWIYNWPRQLITQHATGALSSCSCGVTCIMLSV